MFLWVSIIVIVAFILYVNTKQIPPKAPPGPRRLPFVGNLHQLGSDPVQSLTKIGKDYPDGLFSVQLGDKLAVVMTRQQIAIELNQKKGLKTSGRLETRATTTIVENIDLAFGQYDEKWRFLRKFTHSTLFVPSVLNKTKPVVQDAIDHLITKWNQQAKEGCPVHICEDLSVMANESILKILFGRHMKEESTKTLAPIITTVFAFMGAGDPADYVSWFKYVPSPAYEKFKVVSAALQEYVDNQINKHEQDLGEPQDFTDFLLHNRKLEEFSSKGEHLSNRVIRALLIDLIGAGTDTSSVSIAWTLLLCTHYPHVQEKIHLEMSQFSEQPEMSQLPYLQAVMKESLRFRTPGPLSVPHVVDEKVEVLGYEIPRGTILLHNMWACNFNEKDWENPQVFRPERYLEKDGTINSFGLGPRECVGKNLGKQVLDLALAQLYYRFKFTATKEIDLSPVFGLTYTAKDQTLSVEVRSK